MSKRSERGKRPADTGRSKRSDRPNRPQAGKGPNAKRQPRQPRQPREAHGDAFEVTIEGVALGGSGIGVHRGQAIYVPFTIPGERVLVRSTETRGGVPTARGVRLIDASADRVYPTCEGYGEHGCVRCGWQHIAYSAQTLLKHDLLAETLERAGGVPEAALAAALLPTVPAVQPWAYLHQVTYRITDEGELALPGRGGGTAYARACALIHPDLLDLYDQLDLELAGFSQVRLLRGSLLDGSDGGRMVVLVASEPATPELETDLDASINLILPDNEPLNLIGDSHVTYQPGGPFGALALRVTAGSFVRPNAPMLPALAEAVLALLDPQPAWRVLDLYAGVGVFSAALAPHVSLISLVESYPPAATDADLNLGAFEHVDVIEGSVEAVLEAHAGDAVDAEGDTDALPLHDRYDAAIVDPSGGLGAAVIGGLWARGVHRLVYVSSDPLALARDCALLAARGYALTAVRAIDLMPHTAFVDSIARFDRLDTAR